MGENLENVGHFIVGLGIGTAVLAILPVAPLVALIGGGTALGLYGRAIEKKR